MREIDCMNETADCIGGVEARSQRVVAREAQIGPTAQGSATEVSRPSLRAALLPVAMSAGMMAVPMASACSSRASVRTPAEADFVRVALGGSGSSVHTLCAADGVGRVYCVRADRRSLILWPGLDGVRSLSVSFDEVCGVSANGEVSCDSRFDPFSPTQRARGAVAVAAGGTLTCAHGAGGELRCWGGFPGADSPEGTPTLIGVEDVSVYSRHALVRSADALECFGRNEFGQCTDAPLYHGRRRVALSGVRDVAVSVRTSCALLDDGVWCWGHTGPVECQLESLDGFVHEALPCRNPEPILVLPMPSDRYERIAGGRELLCALTRSGDLYCARLGAVESTLHRVSGAVRDFSVSAGTVCFVRADGRIDCAGQVPSWDLRHPEAVDGS
jgi:hypothetical protein